MVLDFNTEIEILLYDQNKIVTYKQLNSKFEITPSEARNRLSQFINKYRNEKTNDGRNLVFYVTYLVIGEYLETKVKKVFLVNEQDLDSLTNSYKIISKQIYSVQSNFIEDFDLIYGSDLDVSNNNQRKTNRNQIKDCIRKGADRVIVKQSAANVPASTSSSSIGSSAATDTEHRTSKQSGVSVTESKSSTIADKLHDLSKQTKNDLKSFTTKAQESTKEKESHDHHETESNAKKSSSLTGIAAMFNKQATKKKDHKEDEITSVKEEKHDHVIEKEKEKPKEKKVSPPKKARTEKAEKNVSKEIKKECEDIEMLDDDHDTVSPKKKETAKADLFDDEAGIEDEIDDKKEGENNEEEDDAEDDYEDEQINRKRRRKGANKKQQQQNVLNSDEEDNSGNQEKKRKPRSKKPNNNKEIDTMLNKENKSEITSSSQKKKLVTKTFIDKDGYKVTQKVWEAVEDDEIEQIAKPVKTEAKDNESETKSKDISHTKKHNEVKKPLNQPTLTSFFKRN